MATLRVRFEAGLLVRGAAIRALHDYCFDHNLTLQVNESKGLFVSSYYVAATGDEINLRALQATIHRWDKMSSEEAS